MAVETRTILQKMQRELTYAQQEATDDETMKRHIANVQLLSELLLEETSDSSTTAASSRDMNADEIKAMMGGQPQKHMSQHLSRSDVHDGANGESIFDF